MRSFGGHRDKISYYRTEQTAAQYNEAMYITLIH